MTCDLSAVIWWNWFSGHHYEKALICDIWHCEVGEAPVKVKSEWLPIWILNLIKDAKRCMNVFKMFIIFSFLHCKYKIFIQAAITNIK